MIFFYLHTLHVYFLMINQKFEICALQVDGSNINNCRRQGFDNGKNMAGKVEFRQTLLN